MARNDTPTTLAARFMKCSMIYGAVYTKGQFHPILVGELPENLRGVVRQNLSDAPNIDHEKLARYAEFLRKMTTSRPPTTTSTTPRISPAALSKSTSPGLTVSPTPKSSVVDMALELLLLEARTNHSQTNAAR